MRAYKREKKVNELERAEAAINELQDACSDHNSLGVFYKVIGDVRIGPSSCHMHVEIAFTVPVVKLTDPKYFSKVKEVFKLGYELGAE